MPAKQLRHQVSNIVSIEIRFRPEEGSWDDSIVDIRIRDETLEPDIN